MCTFNLYKKLCLINTLHSAWLTVKQKGSAGGIDRQTIDAYQKYYITNLNKLRDSLISKNYSPSPYYTFVIRKDNKQRKLSLSTVQDKIVQQAIKSLIEPIFESQFSPNSYAYRPGKGTVRAIRRVLKETTVGRKIFVQKADIVKFFDTISHGILFQKVSELICDNDLVELIKMFVQNGQVDHRHKWQISGIGIPQGSVISPLLANLYLAKADKFIENSGISFVRYADDYLFMHYDKASLSQFSDRFANYLRTNLLLELRIDQPVNITEQKIKFLGVELMDGKVFLPEKKKQDILNKIRDSFMIKNQTVAKSFFDQLQKFNHYYGKLLDQNTLEEFDNSVLNILRSKLQYAYQHKQIGNKQKIYKAVISVPFLSEKYKSQQRKIAKSVSEAIKKSKYSPVIQKKIRKQKQQYQRYESFSVNLTITTPGVFIGKTARGIVVKQKGKIIKSVPIARLQNINILSGGVSFSTNLIRFCAQNSISINLFNFNGKPFAKIVGPDFSNTALALKQLKATENGKGARLAIRFILGKLKNQKNLVKYYTKYAKNRNSDLLDEQNRLIEKFAGYEAALKDLYRKTPENYKQQLFIIEANSAAIYWNFIKKLLKPYTDFPGRQHGKPADLVNNMLNYGYGILYSYIWKALINARLDPYIGYLHTFKRNQPALVYDFIEEFRPQAVDRVVFSLINKRKGNFPAIESGLSESLKKLLTQKILERTGRSEIFKGKEMQLSQIIQLQALQIADYLNGKIKLYKPYIAKW